MGKHNIEISSGSRFEFGANWLHFLELLNESRIKYAEQSLRDMLGVKDLVGKKFLDAGSGSGLFSLAARRLGATVHSFDFDPQSVACTQILKNKFFPDDNEWFVDEASVLDQNYLGKFGPFDVVYSWGVLHHTGNMWQALDNVALLVADGGYLFIALYNDQGWPSLCWKYVKKIYCKSPSLIKKIILSFCMIRIWGPTTLRDVIKGRPGNTWINYSKESVRGMNPWIDVVDWVGGYPFEVAKPEEIFNFYRDKKFQLYKLKTCAGGKGCNEFVFTKSV